MTTILLVTVLGSTMIVRDFPTYEECEHIRLLVFEPVKITTTEYRCVKKEK